MTTKTTNTAPSPSPKGPFAPGNQSSRFWTSAAFMALASLVLWLPIMFALGYVVTSMFDVDPSAGETITSHGAPGWAAAIGYAALVALPAWLGAWAAVKAVRAGPSAGSKAALGLTILAGLALFVLCVLVPL